MPVRTWARSQTFRPLRTARPDSADEVSELVASAAREALRVKAIGSGHSFTAIADTDGLLLDLSRLRGVIGLEPPAGASPRTGSSPNTGLVTVGAGSTLGEVNRELARHELALANLGDIDRQTIAGAIATGTHGTGIRQPSLAAQVRGLRMVLADGSVSDCGTVLDAGAPGSPGSPDSPDSPGSAPRGAPAVERGRPDIPLEAAAVGLGALGVVTAVTLACVPAFDLRAHEGPVPLGAVLGDLDALLEQNDHVEFYWFGHTDRALLKRNNRVPPGTTRRPVGRFAGWWEDEFLGNGVFGACNLAGTALPRLRPALNRVATRALSTREYVDRSDRVFCSPRRVRFHEMEYAVPRDALPDALAELRTWIDASGELVSFPVEVRFAPAEDAWLSTAYGRDTAYLAVHQYVRVAYERYFRAVERIAADVDGRPHWGKLHWLDAERLGELYPRFEDFRRVRDRVDPTGVFGNAYLSRVLG